MKLDYDEKKIKNNIIWEKNKLKKKEKARKKKKWKQGV